MFIHAMPPQLNTQSTRQPFGKQQVGLKPIASVTMRSGVNEAVPDSFYASLKSTVDQAKEFLANTSGTEAPKTLEARFLASVLSPYFSVKGTPERTNEQLLALNEKLVAYLQADDLKGALRLLDGSHPPLENELKGGKYNPLKGFYELHRRMLAYVQEQPKHKIETKLVRPEFDSIEAFEAYIKEVRSQFQSCLAKVETPQGGAIIPRTTKAIEKVKEIVTEQLERVKDRIALVSDGTFSADRVLNEAIAHNVKTSEASQEMLTRAWIEERVKLALNTVVEGNKLTSQEKERLIAYLKGLFLTLGGETATQGQLALAGLDLPSENSSSIVLAPVTQEIVDWVTATTQFNRGLPDALLKQLPEELRGLKAFQSALVAFQASLKTMTPETLTLARKQVVSEEAKAWLIEAYQLALEQQKSQLSQCLEHLGTLQPTIALPAFFDYLPEAIQENLRSFLLNVAHLPPVEQAKQLKQAFAEMTTQPPQTSVRKSEIKLPSNEGVVFAEPLRVAEKQAEKTEWFPALIDHNKTWLPWVGAGTVALGLLAGVAWWASNRKAPKQEAKN